MADHSNPPLKFYAWTIGVLISLGSAVGFNIWLWNYAEDRWNQGDKVLELDGRLQKIEAREEARINRAIERGSLARTGSRPSTAGAGAGDDHDHRIPAAAGPVDDR